MKISAITDIIFLTVETKIKMAMGSFPSGPLIVYFAPTQRCNFNCKLCKIGKSATIEPREEMDTKRILSLLSELRACGTKIIGIWGGEPLMHKDLGLIIKTAHDLDMYTYMTTNGYLLTPEKRKMLLNNGVSSISISIDHTQPEGHDELRGVKGAFDRTMEGIESLVAEGKGKLNIGINMVVHKNNISEIVPMATLAAKLGVQWFKIMPVHADHPFSEKNFDLSDIQFTPDDCDNLTLAMEEAVSILRKRGLYTNSEYYRKGMLTYFTGANAAQHCKAGYLLTNINSYGDVTLCTRDERVVGNVTDTNFKNVWNSDLFKRIRNERNRSICNHCWLSCFVEPSIRLSFVFHLRNVGTSLKELIFAGAQ